MVDILSSVVGLPRLLEDSVVVWVGGTTRRIKITLRWMIDEEAKTNNNDVESV